MSRVVTINSVVVEVENEIYEHFTRNDELQTVEISLKDTSLLEPYDMGLQVTIVESGNTDYYITGVDDVTRTAIGKYNHRITLVESYKLLEREVLSSLQYTQELGATTYTCLDVVDRALKLLNLEKTSNLGDLRVYDISGIGARDSNDNYIVGNLSGLAELLNSKKAPEMQFNTPSVREVLDEVFLLFDGRPVLEDFTTINIKYYNERNERISLSEVDEITGHQDIEKNAQKFDIYMENAISENNLNKQARIFPSESAWGSVRSSEIELTTNNFLMEVNEDIERVLKFEIYADVDIKDDGLGADFSGEIEVDMTDWLFTERARNALDYNYVFLDPAGTADAIWKGQYLNNSLYFSGNQILGWHDGVDVFAGLSDVKLWHLFIITAAYQGGYMPNLDQPNLGLLNRPSFNSGVKDFMFRLTYVPKETIRTQLERDADVGVGILRANQDARIVDVELLANNMQSKLNRDGAKELVFTKLVTSYSEAFDVRDYYNDYNGVKVDNIRYANGQTLSTITLGEYYAKKSARIDIANKPRQTQISPENTIRNDILTEYCEVAFSVEASNTSSVENTGVNRFLKTFDGTITEAYPVEFATWEDDLIIECTSQGIGKTMSFKFQFVDNIIAGTKIAQLDAIYGNNFVTYAGSDGIKENATIKFYGSFVANPDTFANNALVAQMLPEYDTTITLQEKQIDLGERRILKDSGEVYALSYQINIVSGDDDIFIGNRIAQENGMVVSSQETLYLYSQILPIQVGQVIDTTGMTKQEIVTSSASVGQVLLTSFNTASGGKITFGTNFDSAKYWAICNEDGEVYAICNTLGENELYFNFKETR